MTLLFFWLLMQTPHDGVNRFGPASAPTMLLDHWRIQEGDDPTWADPDLDDQSWMDLKDLSSDQRQGNWWLRTRVEVDETLAETQLFSLCPEGLASAVEIYWDGVRIYENGRIGSDADEEVVGDYYSPTHVAPHLITPGVHVVAIRISNHHASSFQYNPLILFGYYEDLLKGVSIWQIKIYFAVGILFITLVLNGFLFFASGRNPRYLLFFMFCALVAARLLINSLWVFDGLKTTWYDYQFSGVAVAGALVGVTLPVFLVQHFSFPHKWFLPMVFTGNIALYLYPRQDLFFGFLILAIGVVLVHAVWKGRDGALSVLASLTLGLLTLGWDFRSEVDQLTWLSMFMIIAFNFNLSRYFTQQTRLAREAGLRSARLENELLKRNISPHFLMNALTSVIAWMRRDPETAIKLVEALADEFRIVSKIADQQTIPLRQELELCKTHLRVMSIRKGAAFSLEIEREDQLGDQDHIPPMILHTLLENGLTHGYEKRREGRFQFHRKPRADGVEYGLFNDGAAASHKPGSGTGLKYVRSRLKESYGGNWELESKGVEGGWLTLIRINPAQRSQAEAV